MKKRVVISQETLKLYNKLLDDLYTVRPDVLDPNFDQELLARVKQGVLDRTIRDTKKRVKKP